MTRIPALTLTAVLTTGLMAVGSASLAETTHATAKKAPTPSRKEIASQAKGLALATEVTETINDNQLEISHRVLTGVAQCEFNQTVSVDAMQDKPGFFRVAFNKVAYVMTPRETSTGAVRLEDQRNGIVWLQIPTKSMMMNQKVGQRMVDGCTHAEQRAAVQAVKAAATTQ